MNIGETAGTALCDAGTAHVLFCRWRECDGPGGELRVCPRGHCVLTLDEGGLREDVSLTVAVLCVQGGPCEDV